VKIVKVGVPAHFVAVLGERMAMPKDKFYRTIGLVRPTVDCKVRAEKILNQDESERMIGIGRLVGQAQSIVQESGGLPGFNAANGRRPLGQQQSSAYG